MIQLKKVLCPTDFADLSLHALKYARNFARVFQAELHVLHVVDDTSQAWMTMGPEAVPIGPSTQEMLGVARQQMKDFVQERLQDVPFPVVWQVLLGKPCPVIIDYAQAQGIDLIVIGTHGRSGLSHMILGSVAEKIVRTAPCPVLTIRHPEHEFVRN